MLFCYNFYGPAAPWFILHVWGIFSFCFSRWVNYMYYEQGIGDCMCSLGKNPAETKLQDMINGVNLDENYFSWDEILCSKKYLMLQ
jgi:hypothetical protein